MYLTNNENNANKAYTFLAEEKALVPGLIGLLDHSSSVVIRGKALLAFYLMFKINLKWTMVLAENKFGPLLDKLKESTKYIEYCLIHLVDILTEIIPTVGKNIASELKRLKQQNDDPEAVASREQINYLTLLPTIMGVFNSSLLRNKIITKSFLQTIFSIYDYSEYLKDTINVGRSLRSLLTFIYRNNSELSSS